MRTILTRRPLRVRNKNVSSAYVLCYIIIYVVCLTRAHGCNALSDDYDVGCAALYNIILCVQRTRVGKDGEKRFTMVFHNSDDDLLRKRTMARAPRENIIHQVVAGIYSAATFLCGSRSVAANKNQKTKTDFETVSLLLFRS